MKTTIKVIGWPEGINVSTIMGLLSGRVHHLGTCSRPAFLDILNFTEQDKKTLLGIKGFKFEIV